MKSAVQYAKEKLHNMSYIYYTSRKKSEIAVGGGGGSILLQYLMTLNSCINKKSGPHKFMTSLWERDNW